MDWEPKLSTKGNAVYVQIGLWHTEGDQSIHVTNQSKDGPFHVSIVHRGDSPRGHPSLYDALSRVIEAAQ